MECVPNEAKLEFYQSFGKTEESILQDIEILKEWLKTQKHLPEIMQDSHIRNFLHLNKFSIERSKEKIDMYYTMRTLLPEFFPNPESKTIRQFFDDSHCMGVHPKVFNRTERVIFIRNLQPIRTYESSALFFHLLEVRLSEDFLTRDLIFLDFANATINDLKNLNPSFFNKAFKVYQKVYSLRIRGIYFINCPSYFSTVLEILKSVLKPKVMERIKVCNDAKIMEEFLSVEDMPKDYGGQGPSLKELTDNFRETLKKYQERFDLLEKLKVDESLRPVKLNNDELLGFHGNFKKIDVD